MPSNTEPESARAIPARPRRLLTEWSVFGKTMAEVGALPVRPQPGHSALFAPHLICRGPVAQFGGGEPEADKE